MRGALKFLFALAVALVVMLAFRGLVMTVCTIEGDGLHPHFMAGDRVVINRWSYGLRTGEKGSLFDYGRIGRQEIKKGDFIAFDDSIGRLFICRCTALPGDTIKNMVVPGIVNCADQDYYCGELGMIPEERIIGRVCMILFNHHPSEPFWKGYSKERFCLFQ